MNTYYALRNGGKFKIIFMDPASAELWRKKGWEVCCHDTNQQAQEALSKWKDERRGSILSLVPASIAVGNSFDLITTHLQRQHPWGIESRLNPPVPHLRNAPQPPVSRRGAPRDSNRAKKPSLAEPNTGDQELKRGDRVEGLGDFGKPTGKFGSVERANEDDAVVKWDNDGRRRLPQPWLKKV